jgi:hypothetical protein
MNRNKIDYWLEKRQESELRLAKQKKSQHFNEMIRKEIDNLNKQSKHFNQKRFLRKVKYDEDRLRDQLLIKQLKIDEMADLRSYLKDVRMNALSEIEKQRQDIRTALHHMSVWNWFSPDIVTQIWNPKAKKGNMTIDEMVRVNASKEHKLKALRKKRRHSALDWEQLPSINEITNSQIKPSQSLATFDKKKVSVKQKIPKTLDQNPKPSNPKPSKTKTSARRYTKDPNSKSKQKPKPTQKSSKPTPKPSITQNSSKPTPKEPSSPHKTPFSSQSK